MVVLRLIPFRRRLRFRLDDRLLDFDTPFHERLAHEWRTFSRKREQAQIVARHRWRLRMGLPSRRPLYGYMPFHHQRRRIYS